MSIVKILMRRDDIDEAEAKARVQECRRRLEEEAVSEGDYELAQDIVAEELGLEPDYLIELLM